METYDDLAAEIAFRLGRSDLSAQIPTFVAFAEKAIARRLRVRESQRVETFFTLLDGTHTPERSFISAGELRRSDNIENPLDYDAPQGIFSRSNETNQQHPGYYTVQGNKVYVRPTPDYLVWGTSDGGYLAPSGHDANAPSAWGRRTDFWMRYYSRPDPLGPTVQQNELFPTYADIYLDGALWRAHSFARNFEAANFHQGEMNTAIDALNIVNVAEAEGAKTLQITPQNVA